MIFPTTLKEIKNLLNKIPENLHLEYKSGRAINHSEVKEISKDVSAFANSDGGVLIYGVQEDRSTHLPVSIDGVDSKIFSHEWIENIIKSNITPIIPDLKIEPIKITGKSNLVIYSILIPKSHRTPHQAKDKKYYKRYNFKSEAMEDYEINDIRNRRQIIPPLVNISAKMDSSMSVFLEIENVGNQVAQDVTFDFSGEFKTWVDEEKAKTFNTGIKYFSPSQKYRFRYGFINSILHESWKYPAQFEISASYNHPLLSERLKETFGIDLLSYFGTYAEKSDTTKQGEKIEKEIKELTKEVKKIGESLLKIARISNSTGLGISISTLRDLKNLIERKPFEKIDPTSINYLAFKEILEIDFHLASNLEHFFWQGNEAKGLKNVEGINGDVIEKIEKCFILEGEIS
jgi:hypothetical protein